MKKLAVAMALVVVSMSLASCFVGKGKAPAPIVTKGYLALHHGFAGRGPHTLCSDFEALHRCVGPLFFLPLHTSNRRRRCCQRPKTLPYDNPEPRPENAVNAAAFIAGDDQFNSRSQSCMVSSEGCSGRAATMPGMPISLVGSSRANRISCNRSPGRTPVKVTGCHVPGSRARQPDDSLGQFHDPNRLPHVEHIDRTTSLACGPSAWLAAVTTRSQARGWS